MIRLNTSAQITKAMSLLKTRVYVAFLGSARGSRAPFGGPPNGPCISTEIAPRAIARAVRFMYFPEVFRPAAENSTPAACVTHTRRSRELFPEAQSAQTKKQIRHHNKH
jgi:hypothetical protein